MSDRGTRTCAARRRLQPFGHGGGGDWRHGPWLLERERDEREEDGKPETVASPEEVSHFTTSLRRALHETFRRGEGTRDMSGPTGLTTEQFVDKVGWRLGLYLAGTEPAKEEAVEIKEDVLEVKESVVIAELRYRRNYNVDKPAVKALFRQFDTNGDGRPVWTSSRLRCTTPVWRRR